MKTCPVRNPFPGWFQYFSGRMLVASVAFAALFLPQRCSAGVVAGELFAWGRNDFNQAAAPEDLTNVTAAAVGLSHSVALKNDGVLVSWGTSSGISMMPDVVGLAAGQYLSLILHSDGTVTGEGTTIPTGLADVAAVSANGKYCLALKRNGTVVAWGWGWDGSQYVTPDLPPNLSNVVAIAAGQAHGLALKSNGELVAWGDNTYGQTEIPAGLTNVVAIEANQFKNLALTADGRLIAWGEASVASAESNIVEIASGASHDLALRGDGTIFTWGNNSFGVTDVPPEVNNVFAIAAGGWNSVALKNKNFCFASREPLQKYFFSGAPSFTLQAGIANFPISSYQWRCNGTNIPAATNALLTLFKPAIAQSGIYSVVVSNLYGENISSNVVLEVTNVPPFFFRQPVAQTVAPGNNALFSAEADGSLPIFYQWRFNGTNIAGATNRSLNLTNVQLFQDGNYDVIASNAYGTTNSSSVLLHVLNLTEALDATNLTWVTGGDAPWFSQGAKTHAAGAAAQSGAISGDQQSFLQTSVDGPGTLSFWWNVYSEENNDYFSFSIDGQEQSRISGNWGWQQKTFYLPEGHHDLIWTYSKNAVVDGGTDAVWLDEVAFEEGGTPAFITSQPGNRLAPAMTNVQFNVTATGTPPLSYQWLFNGNVIPDATNTSLTLSNLGLADAGNYSVAVSNSYGGTNSNNARLTVLNVFGWGAGTVNNGVSPNFGQSIVPSLSNAVAIVAGGYHSLALMPTGRVIAWGWFTSGQTSVPFNVTNVVGIAAGLQHSIALRGNGTCAGWGFSGYGQTVAPTSATNLIEISAGWHHNLGLRSDGTVVAWGAGTVQGASPHFGQSVVPAGLSNVISIAGGGFHSLALKSDGTVVGWGLNASGQTDVPPSLSNVVAIAAGSSNSLALKADGSIVAWGDNTYGQASVPANATDIVAISAGGGHNLALRSDGTIISWGLNGNNQTMVPSNLVHCIGIAAGANHSLALLNAGSLSFITQPRGRTMFKGDSWNLYGAAVGAGPLTYQWQRNSVDLPGETNRLLSITDAQVAQSGSYRLVVSNSSEVVTSSVAQLNIDDTAPFFALQPADKSVLLNSNVSLVAIGGGVAPFSFQWRFNETPLPGETNATLFITNAQPDQEGFYSVLLSNALGVAISSNAFLNVVDLGDALDAPNLVWSTEPNLAWFAQTNVTHGGFAAARSESRYYMQQNILRTTAVGPGTLSFWWKAYLASGFSFSVNGIFQPESPYSQWKKATVYLAGGTNVLQWSYRLLFPNPENAAYLDEVSFVPGTTAALIVTPPADRVVNAGTNVTFSVKAGGTPPLSYQWQFNGSNLTGAQGSSLTLTNVQWSNVGVYSVSVSNDDGFTNAVATLTVTPAAPSILTQPSDQEMVNKGTVTFTVNARGSDPLHYQWQRDNADIPGATGSSLTLENVGPNSAASYRVIVANEYGTNVSSSATLTMVPSVIVGCGFVFTSSPNPPLGLTNVAGIAAGDNFSVALKEDSTLFAWGWDAFSRLDIPENLTNVTMVSAGGFHGSALVGDGTVVDWGSPVFDEAAVVPAGLSNVVKVAAGDRFNLALLRDGTVAAWGANTLAGINLPDALTDVVDIAAGQEHGLALKADGSVVAWGAGAFGTTNVPPGLSNVVAIAATSDRSFALTSEGSLLMWGNSVYGVTNILPDISDAVAIDGGNDHFLVLRRNGTVVGWGGNGSGQLNFPPWLTNVVAISAGYTHSLALLNDGSPYVVREPWTRTVLPGATVSFQVDALGQAPLSFQWQFNGSKIEGATNPVLTLSSVSLSDVGNYDCVISNAVGSATSRPAGLSVLRSPHFVHERSGFDGAGHFRLALTGLSGHGNVIVYSSSNLIDWQPIFTNAPVIGTLEIADPEMSGGGQRFYRIVEQ